MATAIRVAFAVTLLLFSSAVAAGTARVHWQPSTQRVDGTPVTISVYNVYYSMDPGEFPQFMTVTEGALEYTFEQLSPGTWYFAATAVDDDGLESALSNVVSKTIDDVNALPEAPPGATVQQDAAAAYIINQAAGFFVLIPAGTVAPGTPCDPSQAVRDANGVTAYLVPESAVSWSGTVRRSVVFAQCGN